MQHNSALSQSLMVLSFVSAGLLLSVHIFSPQRPPAISSLLTTQQHSKQSDRLHFPSLLSFSFNPPELQHPATLSEHHWSMTVAHLFSPRGFWEATIGRIVDPSIPSTLSQALQSPTTSREIPARFFPEFSILTTLSQSRASTSSQNASKHILATSPTSTTRAQGTHPLPSESKSIESISTHPTTQAKEQISAQERTQEQTQGRIQTEQQSSHQMPSGGHSDLKLVVDLSDRQLVLYHQGVPINTYPVSVGKAGWETPLGEFAVTHKDPNPTWRNPLTGDIIPPEQGSPLGSRWIGFWSDGIHEIGFHGTNQTQSIGQAMSHGCIRLHDADIQTLYSHVDIGTLVVVQP